MSNAQNLAVLTSQQYLLQNILDKSGQTGGKFDLVNALNNKLPHPKKGWVLPGYRYLGPANPLEEQLDENDKPRPGFEPVNGLDTVALHHDICTRDAEALKDKHKCDQIMLDELKELKPKTFGEKVAKKLSYGVIAAKKKLGWGISKEQHNILNKIFN